MSKLELRPYQKALHDETMTALKRFKHALIVAPCGGGKTFIFSYLSHLSSLKSKRLMILSNRSELLAQAGGSLSLFGVNAEYISPEYKQVPSGLVSVAMAQTLRRRYRDPAWEEYLRSLDVLIIDEAHLCDFDYIFESGLFNDKFVLGYTATPRRDGKQRQLGLDYDCIVQGVDADTLMNQGWLVRAKYYAVDAPDLSRVEVDSLTGDYKSSQLHSVFNTPERFSGVVENYRRICPGKPAIAYCCNQAHAIQTCAEFNRAGIPAKFIISGIKKDSDDYVLLQENLAHTSSRKKIFEEFKGGEFSVLCNASIATTGTDLPIASVCILNCATMSLTRYLQEVGRISRPYPGKEFGVVLDMGGNLARFGIYEAPRKWSVWHDSKEPSGIAMTKECPKLDSDKNGKTGCGRLIPISSQECPFCGFVFKTEKELREVELVEIIGGVFKYRDMSPVQLAAHAELKGYHKNWVFNQLWIGASSEKAFRDAMRGLGYSNDFCHQLTRRFKSRKK